MNNKSSSRRLSTYEYFENLQIEYLVCKLRARIYPSPSDKEYWNKIAEFKKNKFCEIAERNFLPTIIEDKDEEEFLKRKIYRNFTYPLFSYSGENQRRDLECTDLLFYYMKGSEIRISENNEIRIAKIQFYKPFSNTLTAKLIGTNELITAEISKCSRIL
jgi:hypothetical protein